MSTSGWRPALAPAVVALLALGFAATELPTAGQKPSTDYLYKVKTPVGQYEYGPEARALLGGLAPGDKLASDWQVRALEGPLRDGRVRILIERDEASFVISVLPTGRSRLDPPAGTDKWDIFYGEFVPHAAELEVDEARPLLDAMVERVRANE